MSHIQDLQRGAVFLSGKNLYEVIETAPLRVRNLRTWRLIRGKLSANKEFQRVEIERRPARFMYGGDGVYVFCDAERPVIRFALNDEQVGDRWRSLTMGTDVELLTWNGKIINISLPEEGPIV